MPTVFPLTKLDLHNIQVRAALLSPATRKAAPEKAPKPDAMDSMWDDPHKHALNSEERAAMQAAHQLYGTTVFFGGSENAAAEALQLLEGYHATINGTEHVWIEKVDLNLGLMRGVRSDPATGERRLDRPYAISLHDISSVAL